MSNDEEVWPAPAAAPVTKPPPLRKVKSDLDIEMADDDNSSKPPQLKKVKASSSYRDAHRHIHSCACALPLPSLTCSPLPQWQQWQLILQHQECTHAHTLLHVCPPTCHSHQVPVFRLTVATATVHATTSQTHSATTIITCHRITLPL